MINTALFTAISEHFGLSLSADAPISVAGGDINECVEVKSSDGTRYFIKLNKESELLACEASNLNLMTSASAITPKVVGFARLNNVGVLVLQHVALSASGDEQALGRQLAHLHQSTSDQYGLGYNNYIGRTLQRNGWHSNWAQFWWDCRLAPQVLMAERAGFNLGIDAPRLKVLSDNLLLEHNPPASLLHGDLWGGNKGYLTDGRPVLFDPASYYGDREADLAFTLVFGGFGHEFYRSYKEVWPLPARWQARESLYNLYHLLNHLNLFGSSYLGSVHSAIKSLQG
ncbi:fructosamine kinase family protein [uncultured Gilvimarinus sp.]|uniref:fructosamine kinase family protein n=1 Tax=uncultured Gilvimarinus sp. TaxID=1689143 RepID=UPI0030DA7570